MIRGPDFGKHCSKHYTAARLLLERHLLELHWKASQKRRLLEV
jgi:hypothetical protein